MSATTSSGSSTCKVSEPDTSLVTDIQSHLEGAIEEWLSAHCNEKAITAWVTTVLDQHRITILMKLMGFSNKWHGEWELDHCNGRSGESAASDRLRELVGERVKEWLSENAIKLPKLPAAAIASLRENYKRQFERSIREEITNLANAHAKEAAQQIIFLYTGQPEFPAVLPESKKRL